MIIPFGKGFVAETRRGSSIVDLVHEATNGSRGFQAGDLAFETGDFQLLLFNGMKRSSET